MKRVLFKRKSVLDGYVKFLYNRLDIKKEEKGKSVFGC